MENDKKTQRKLHRIRIQSKKKKIY